MNKKTETDYYTRRFYGDLSTPYVFYMLLYLVFIAFIVAPNLISGLLIYKEQLAAATALYMFFRLITSLLRGLTTPSNYLFNILFTILITALVFWAPIIGVIFIVIDFYNLFAKKGLLSRNIRTIKTSVDSVRETKLTEDSELVEEEEEVEEEVVDLVYENHKSIIDYCDVNEIHYLETDDETWCSQELVDIVYNLISKDIIRKPDRVWSYEGSFYIEFSIKKSTIMFEISDKDVYMSTIIDNDAEYKKLAINFSDINKELHDFMLKNK